MVDRSRARVGRTWRQTDAERTIASFVASAPPVRELLHLLRAAIGRSPRVLLVGGVLRDVLLDRAPALKDIDVVVEGVSQDTLLARVAHASRNFFGGLTLEARDAAVDVWALHETYHIREFGLAPTIENFLAGAPFNLDRAAFDVSHGTLFEAGLLEGLAHREISYGPTHAYFEHIQAARAVLLRAKLAFSFAPSTDLLLSRAAQVLHDPARLAELDGFLANAHGLMDAGVRARVAAEIAASGEQATTQQPV